MRIADLSKSKFEKYDLFLKEMYKKEENHIYDSNARKTKRFFLVFFSLNFTQNIPMTKIEKEDSKSLISFPKFFKKRFLQRNRKNGYTEEQKLLLLSKSKREEVRDWNFSRSILVHHKKISPLA